MLLFYTLLNEKDISGGIKYEYWLEIGSERVYNTIH